VVLEITVKSLYAMLATYSRRLHPTKRQLVVNTAESVDPRIARFDAASEGPSRGVITAPYRSTQSIRGFVGDAYCFIQGVKSQHGEHGAEGFLDSHPRRARRLNKQRWRHEPTSLRALGVGSASTDQRRTVSDRIVDLRLKLVSRGAGVQRAHGGGFVVGRADNDPSDALRQHRRHLIHNGSVGDKPLRSDAHLPGVVEACAHERPHGAREIGVFAYDKRITTTKLEA
jgi:hypothetical protein